MLIRATVVQPSRLHGMGCFLAEDVRAGAVIWIFHPRFDLLLSQEEVAAYAPAFQSFVRHYGYLDQQQFPGWWVLHTGNDRFCNHSPEPTLKTRHLSGARYDMVASKDLRAGDELTCDYREYGEAP